MCHKPKKMVDKIWFIIVGHLWIKSHQHSDRRTFGRNGRRIVGSCRDMMVNLGFPAVRRGDVRPAKGIT